MHAHYHDQRGRLPRRGRATRIVSDELRSAQIVVA